VEQLGAYFAGELREFDLPLDLRAAGAANGSNPIHDRGAVPPGDRGGRRADRARRGGVPLKRFLLDLEARHSHLFQEV
jgi:hypothetical protein